ncbi:dTMP kinase [Paenibacillus sp. SI8]|uniref:dTMP kinase n=1 Tax=unclassified Paenibacillus TaxID=185978 RepID=UPI0034653159
MNKSDESILHGNRGALIVFEGISGSGKSEGIVTLLRYLSELGHAPIVMEWNSNSIIRALVSKLDRMRLLTSNVYSVLQWISFMIDYMSVVRPAMISGKTVIADRYIYTGLTRDEVNGATRWIGRLIHRWIRKPHLVLYYNTRPQVCHERIRKRGKTLFHTKRAKGDTPVDELSYLVDMQQAYSRILSKMSSKEVDVIFIEESSIHMEMYAAACIQRIAGHRYRNSSSSVANRKEKAREM